MQNRCKKKTEGGNVTNKLSSYFEQQAALSALPASSAETKAKNQPAKKIDAIWKDKFEEAATTTTTEEKETPKRSLPSKTMSKTTTNKWSPGEKAPEPPKKAEALVLKNSGKVTNAWTPGESDKKPTEDKPKTKEVEIKKSTETKEVETKKSTEDKGSKVTSVWTPSENEVKKTVVDIPVGNTKVTSVWTPSENEVRKTVVDMPQGAGASKVATVWQQILEEKEKKLQEEANLPAVLRKKAEEAKELSEKQKVVSPRDEAKESSERQKMVSSSDTKPAEEYKETQKQQQKPEPHDTKPETPRDTTPVHEHQATVDVQKEVVFDVGLGYTPEQEPVHVHEMPHEQKQEHVFEIHIPEQVGVHESQHEHEPTHFHVHESPREPEHEPGLHESPREPEQPLFEISRETEPEPEREPESIRTAENNGEDYI